MAAGQGKAVLVLLVLSAMAAAVSAGVFTVGGESGWTFGSQSTVSLNVGDTIHFTYPPSQHNVWQVSHDDYDSCHSDAPYATYYSGSDDIYISSPGAYYFICAVEGHCGAGMKVAIYV